MVKKVCEKCYHSLRLCPCCNQMMYLDNRKLVRRITPKTKPIENTEQMYGILKSIISSISFDGVMYIDKEGVYNKTTFDFYDNHKAPFNYDEYKKVMLDALKDLKLDETYDFDKIFICDNCFYKLKRKHIFNNYEVSRPKDDKKYSWCWSNIEYYEISSDYIGDVKYSNFLYKNLKYLPLKS